MKKILLLIVLTGIAGVSLCQQKQKGSGAQDTRQKGADLTHRRDSLRTGCDNSYMELEKLSDQIAQTAGELKEVKKTGPGIDQAKIDSLHRRVLVLTDKKQACQRRFDRELEELDSVVGKLNKVMEQLAKEQQHP